MDLGFVTRSIRPKLLVSLTVVLVGSSNSRLAHLGEGPRMYTPRGYARRIDGDLKGART